MTELLGMIQNHIFETVITAAITVLSVFGRKLYRRLAQEIKEQDDMRDGLLAILQSHLYEALKQHLRDGCCPTPDRQVLETMYNSYAELGGNGVVKDMYKRVRRLPHWKENENEN